MSFVYVDLRYKVDIGHCILMLKNNAVHIRQTGTPGPYNAFSDDVR